jgi:glucose-6-phosphate 1-dehydrogenase
VIFGATGDLTRRKLVPALHSLACSGLLSDSIEITGVGRRPLEDEAFRAQLFDGIQAYARLKSSPHLCTRWTDLSTRFRYVQLPDLSASAIQALLDDTADRCSTHPLRTNLLFYVATPPEAVPAIISSIGRAVGSQQDSVSSGWTRVVLEKPFGRDQESAQALDILLAQSFDEHQMYRIDHYLGKETVQNLLAFRFANCIFEPLWNNRWVQHVQITAAESIGVEGRGASYDRLGVVRDVLQNHMMQLLSLIAMEPPVSLDSKSLRDEKVRLLQSVQPVDRSAFVLGQYESYPSEDGVATGTATPTYAAVRLDVDNPRWRGVPFYLRSGKRMAKKTTEITLQFKPVSRTLLPGKTPRPNRLSLHIQPDEGMRLQFAVKAPGAGMNTEVEDMSFLYRDRYPESEIPDAYERLLLDALQGDPSLFIRRDEIDAAWRIVQPLVDTTGHPNVYRDGSWGPEEASRLIREDKCDWLTDCQQI